MNNQNNKPAQVATQNPILSLKETFSLNWQRIVDAGKSDKGHSERIFQKFICLLETNHCEQHSPKFYADELNTTRSNLWKTCIQAVGFSTTKCIHARIMYEAIHKLSNTTASVKQIAFELGFEDTGYFIRFFKKLSGISPNYYRKTY